METMNNCITAIIFRNGKKLISLHCNVSLSYRLCIELQIQILLYIIYNFISKTFVRIYRILYTSVLNLSNDTNTT